MGDINHCSRCKHENRKGKDYPCCDCKWNHLNHKKEYKDFFDITDEDLIDEIQKVRNNVLLDSLNVTLNPLKNLRIVHETKVDEVKHCGCCVYCFKPCDSEPCTECKRNPMHFGKDISWKKDCFVEKREEEVKDITPDLEAADHVNHPSHYNREGAIECIDEMIKTYGPTATAYFCLLNAHKYRYRSSSKNGEEDMKKSDWYMNKYIELVGGSELIITPKKGKTQ